MIPQSSWEVRLSNSRGVHYFYNTLTQESVWDPPSELTKEQIDALLGASNLGPKPEKVRASHILVKHGGSRRPSSWKEASPTLRFTVPHRARRGGFHFHFLSINLSLTMHPGGPLLFFPSLLLDSRISRAPKRKRSRSCGDTRRRSGGAETSLARSRASTRIAPRTTTMAIWAGSGLGRCRSHLKMPHLGCVLERSVVSSRRRAGCTLSCALNDSWGEKEEEWSGKRGRVQGRACY